MSYNIFYTANHNEGIEITHAILDKARRQASALKKREIFRHERLEDLKGELLTHLIGVLSNFNPEKSNPETFAENVFYRKAKQMYRNQARQKRGMQWQRLSLEDWDQQFDETDTAEHSNPQDTTYSRCKNALFNDAVSAAEESLPPKIKTVIKLLRYHNRKEVSRMTGLSYSTVKEYIKQARKQFRHLRDDLRDNH